MFSMEVVGSDAFLDMPISSQALYFHLGMAADDDGFVGNPKRTLRTFGGSDDDLKVLVAKKFVIPFPSGILVIKHNRINNKWDKYNCRRTVYSEEFSKLFIKENRAYTLDSSQGVSIQSVYSLEADSKLNKTKLNKTNKEAPKNNQNTDPRMARINRSRESLARKFST